MSLLLDTHALFWWIAEKGNLSASAHAAIATPTTEVFVSVASAWEMSIKVGVGKWPEALALVDEFEKHIALEHFRLLPISVAHVRMAGLMMAMHRDPFDRILAAQSSIERLTIVTADQKLAGLGVPVLW